VRLQSQHFDDYRAALDRLGDLGVLYPCFCTRREIRAEIARAGGAPQGEAPPPYPGTCRSLNEGQRNERLRSGSDFALRLDIARAIALTGPLDWVEEGGASPRRVCAIPARHGDTVLARKDIPASYHFAVTVDDAIQGVILVTRGEDLAPATDIHRALQALLGLPTPRYHHHKLLLDAGGRRLAKRDFALTIRSMRVAGAGPEEVLAKAGC
jgi:glutamyl-Q tRNA(Asp) synthetase